MKQRGFTVIELIVAIALLSLIGIVFWNQKNDIEAMSRDTQRRNAINAMYYALEDVFYAKNHYYPSTINEKNLTSMDKGLFTDPDGTVLGESGSNYRYEPTSCNGEQCSGYTLRSSMEKEADFVKTNRNH